MLTGQRELILFDENPFEDTYYIGFKEFENLVFSNGDFTPDDRLYIYECVWKFEKEINQIDKVKLLSDYIESEDVETLIYEEINQ